jgi:protein required for attachment to host cells
MKAPVTWILVADHQTARILSNVGIGKGLQEHPELRRDTHLHPTHDLMADRQGRSFESADTARHAMEAKSDAHRLEGRAFLDAAVQTLAHAQAGGRFDRLILVAPPRALGELRALLPEALRACVIGELDCDLVQQTPERIAPHLAPFLAL